MDIDLCVKKVSIFSDRKVEAPLSNSAKTELKAL